MSYWEHLYGSTLFWISLSGMFFGLSFARLSRLRRKPFHSTGTGARARRRTIRRLRAGSESYRSRTWVLFFLGLTAACLLALAAVFLPGARGILDSRVPWFFFGSALLFLVAFRFRKSVGIPLLVLAAAVIVLGFYALSSWSFAGAGDEILRFRCLSVGGGSASATVEITVPADLPPEAAFLSLGGSTVGAFAEVLVFDPAYFFLPGRFAYRNLHLDAVTNAESGAPPPAATSGSVEAGGLAGYASGLLLSNVDSMPGVELIDSQAEPLTLFPLKTYAVRIGSGGRLSVKQVGL
ncbi:hypothetical protein [Salinispira pacifica]